MLWTDSKGVDTYFVFSLKQVKNLNEDNSTYILKQDNTRQINTIKKITTD